MPDSGTTDKARLGLFLPSGVSDLVGRVDMKEIVASSVLQGDKCSDRGSKGRQGVERCSGRLVEGGDAEDRS